MDYDVCRAWKVHLSTSTKHLHLICDVYKKKMTGADSATITHAKVPVNFSDRSQR